MRLRVQHTLLPGAKPLRLPVPADATVQMLGSMLAERLGLKAHPDLAFETADGDSLSAMDRVGDLLEDGETVVASVLKPAIVPAVCKPVSVPAVCKPAFVPVCRPVSVPSIGRPLFVGMVPPAVEESEPAAAVAVPVVQEEVEPAQFKLVLKQTRLTVEVPEAAFGALIGTKGSTVAGLQKAHKVKLDLDRKKACCVVRASSAAAAKAGAAAVRKVVAHALKQTEQHARREMLSTVRRLPQHEAKQALSVERRIKTLRSKLRKIAAIRVRAAKNDALLEHTELAQLTLEAQYNQELQELCQRERLPVKRLKERVARKGEERNTTELANEFEWRQSAIVPVLRACRC